MQVDEKKGTVNSSFYNLIITGRGQHETRINHVTSSHAEIVKLKRKKQINMHAIPTANPSRNMKHKIEIKMKRQKQSQERTP
jgi:hypothetical protein